MDLITKDEAKEFLKVDFADEDALIAKLIKQASSEIQKKHQRELVQGNYVDEEYNGEGHEMLFIKNWPIQSISSIKLNDVEVDPDSYSISKASGIVKLDQNVPDDIANVKVSYIGGYAADDPELEAYKLECVLLVADLYEGRGAS
jgi:uncharacterized phiE125 gp8 family phage protein